MVYRAFLEDAHDREACEAVNGRYGDAEELRRRSRAFAHISHRPPAQSAQPESGARRAASPGRESPAAGGHICPEPDIYEHITHPLGTFEVQTP